METSLTDDMPRRGAHQLEFAKLLSNFPVFTTANLE